MDKICQQTDKLLHCIQHRRRWTKKSYAFNFCWRRSKWYYWRTTVWTNHTRKKTKHTSISSSWLCKTTSTQKTTLSITDLYSEKKTHPKRRGLSSGIKRGSSYVPFHSQKCRNKIPANNGLFIRKSSSKGTDEPKHAPRRSNKLCQNDRNHIQINGTDALRRRQLYYKTYHIR